MRCNRKVLQRLVGVPCVSVRLLFVNDEYVFCYHPDSHDTHFSTQRAAIEHIVFLFFLFSVFFFFLFKSNTLSFLVSL